MIEESNFKRILAQLDKSDDWVPVPARYVSELVLAHGVTDWRDPEIGPDSIDKVSTYRTGGNPIVIEGPRKVGGYDSEDSVAVRRRAAASWTD